MIDSGGNVWVWSEPGPGLGELGELGFWNLIVQGVTMAAGAIAGFTGRPLAFILALSAVIVWAVVFYTAFQGGWR